MNEWKLYLYTVKQYQFYFRFRFVFCVAKEWGISFQKKLYAVSVGKWNT